LDVWTYFQQRETEAEELSLAPIGNYWRMVRAEEGSNDKRGRIFGDFALTEEVRLRVSEVVVVEDDHVHREEYAYFLVHEDDEVWGYERDLSHDPPVHRHVGPDHWREPAEPISFGDVVELAWEEVTRIYEQGPEGQ
jgi:hypothetical protein